MSLYSITKNIPECFFICIINSSFMSYYVDDFVNNTQTFQINDARQIPIIVPSKEQLEKFEGLFNDALVIKKKQFSNKISIEMAEKELSAIQEKLDELVVKLYQIV